MLPPAIIERLVSFMWIADRWKDYEVLDCSGGEKLERWGDFLLIRPDPQVIWETPKENRGWRRPNGHYHAAPKAAANGNFSIFPAVDHRISWSYLQPKAIQL